MLWVPADASPGGVSRASYLALPYTVGRPSLEWREVASLARRHAAMENGKE
jgi:hypothetical protein